MMKRQQSNPTALSGNVTELVHALTLRTTQRAGIKHRG